MKAWLRMPMMGALLAVATAAHASSGAVNNTTITNLAINSGVGGNVLWIQTATAPTGGPNCVQSSWSFTLSLGTALGENQYAMLLAALATGQTVSLGGTGACSDWGNVESLQNVVLAGS